MSDPITAHADYPAIESWWADRVATAVQPSNANYWQYKLGAIGEVVVDLDDIDQAIKIILQTPRGTDVHRPDFASDLHNYIDYPVPRATPYVVRDSLEAIALWESRVVLRSVSVQQYTPELAGVKVNLKWTLPDSAIEQLTTVDITRVG